MRSMSLALWGGVLLLSSLTGRLDLLLQSAFHPLVAGSGLVLLIWGLQQLWSSWREPRQLRSPITWWLSSVVALLVLIVPPNPSFSELVANRPNQLADDSSLSFVSPPAQRTLTDWVRLMNSQPDPKLYVGDPVRISGFVLPQPGDRPQLARLLVRCCLADATPVGLPMRWPKGFKPRADTWLAVRGRMELEEHNGQIRTVVAVQHLNPIPRPKRPLEP